MLQYPLVVAIAPEHGPQSAQFASAAFFFMFGDRMYMHMKRGG